MQKTNFKTRLLALLTAVFMVIMCVPFAAFADDTAVTVKFQGTGDDWQTVYKQEVLSREEDSIEVPGLPEGYDFWQGNNDAAAKNSARPGETLSYADVKNPYGMIVFQPAKNPEPTTQTIYVSYIEEGNPSNVVGREQFQLEKSETYFNTCLLYTSDAADE